MLVPGVKEARGQVVGERDRVVTGWKGDCVGLVGHREDSGFYPSETEPQEDSDSGNHRSSRLRVRDMMKGTGWERGDQGGEYWDCPGEDGWRL